jgi:hypothetical protein
MKSSILLFVAAAGLALAGVALARSSAVIVGTPGPDSLDGTPAADVVYAKGGDDTVRAGDGSDVVYGQGGSDELHAGDGHDVLYGGAGNDAVHGGQDGDIEYGGDGNDSLWGGQGADQLFGGAGDDVLHALANDNQFDMVNCGPGDDLAWLNVRERGLYRVRGCERINWVIPTTAQEAEEDAG